MMPLQDVASFALRRARLDTPQVFCARMLRLGILGLYSSGRELRASGLRSATACVRSVQGSDMWLNPKDVGISTDLLLDGIREPLITKAFRSLLRKGDTVIDCGANIGYYALQEAQAVGPTGRVHAIEPVTSNVRVLQSNIYLNGYNNVRVHYLAVGDGDRDDYINISTMSNMCSMVKKQGYRRYVDKLPVRVTSIDSFMDKYDVVPDVIRMDVEGYETEIVRGMGRLLKSGGPLRLFMEVHFDILLDAVLPMLRTLKEHGFGVTVATFEPHAAVRKSRLAYPVVRWLEGVMGASSGYLYLTIDDLLTRKEFRTGQVEDLEVIFERC